MNYILNLAIFIGIYLPLAYSLNLIIGFGGLISFCHAAFYGIGSYTYAILVCNDIMHPISAILTTILFTGALAWVIGGVSLRFRDDLFLFATLGFQMIIFVVLYNWIPLTNGSHGIGNIPSPQVFGWLINTPSQYFGLAVAMNLILLPLIFLIYRSPFGFVLKALRENELMGESLGINPNHIYLQAFIFAACIASMSGVFFATYVTFIDPTSFSLKESIFQVTLLLVGGSGNRKGPFIGVIIMLILPEILRFIGLPDMVAHNLREMIYGLTLILLMYYRPQGFAGEFKVN